MVGEKWPPSSASFGVAWVCACKYIFPLGTLAVYMTEGCCHNLAFGGCRGHCSQVGVCVCSSATLLD